MRFRKLKIAFSATCAMACVLMIAQWKRSYRWADTVLWRYDAPNAIRMRCRTGRIQTEAIIDEPVFLDVLTASSQTLVKRWEPTFHSVRLKDGMPDFDDRNSLFVPFVPDDAGVVAPIWSLVMVFAVLGAAPWIRRRFTVRGLLIATTIVALALGLIVYATLE